MTKNNRFVDAGILDSIRTDDSKKNFIALISMTVLYLTSSYLFGIVYMSPVFIIAWSYWANISWRNTLLILLTVLIFHFVLMAYFNSNLANGLFDPNILSMTVSTGIERSASASAGLIA